MKKRMTGFLAGLATLALTSGLLVGSTSAAQAAPYTGIWYVYVPANGYDFGVDPVALMKKTTKPGNGSNYLWNTCYKDLSYVSGDIEGIAEVCVGPSPFTFWRAIGESEWYFYRHFTG